MAKKVVKAAIAARRNSAHRPETFAAAVAVLWRGTRRFRMEIVKTYDFTRGLRVQYISRSVERRLAIQQARP